MFVNITTLAGTKRVWKHHVYDREKRNEIVSGDRSWYKDSLIRGYTLKDGRYLINRTGYNKQALKYNSFTAQIPVRQDSIQDWIDKHGCTFCGRKEWFYIIAGPTRVPSETILACRKKKCYTLYLFEITEKK